MNSAWEAMQQRRAHPARTVVLLPDLQLMAPARQAWLELLARLPDGASAHAQVFLPRLETSASWARSVAGFVPADDDLSFDAGRDVLVAAALLERAGLGAHSRELADSLMQSAWQLAGPAAAIAPAQRGAWVASMRGLLAIPPAGAVLALEAATQAVALEWAAASAYASDALWTVELDCLVIVQGLRADPLSLALQSWFAGAACVLPLAIAGAAGQIRLHAASDAEEEAELAAACVLNALLAGHAPVALIAQDRALTRRVRAMLGARQVALRDLSGWKLSTVRAAAQLMGLLRAVAWNASSDQVLDWLKNAPAFAGAGIEALEARLRKSGTRDWRSVGADDVPVTTVNRLRESLQRARTLSHWLLDLSRALQQAGQWDELMRDEAGQAALAALHLQDGAAVGLERWSRRMSLSEFSAWVDLSLEAASFVPIAAAQEQVVILPLEQLPGRAFAALVMPGCDESNLPASPEPPGLWTRSQREALGLPVREGLARELRAAWAQALQTPQVDLLWRESEQAEPVLPSALVQLLQLQSSAQSAAQPRRLRWLVARPGSMPAPGAAALSLQRLSASAYEDLRQCPYRFFALRLLGLQISEELEGELGKREFGSWLHGLLKLFHETLAADATADRVSRRQWIDAAAEQAAREMALHESEFLPFAAAWPRVREGYLDWLQEHEREGHVFAQAEVWKEQPLGALSLIGRLDRVDRQADGSSLLIDYKTESRSRTAQRIKEPEEDTQLAFYAALMSDDQLGAAYLNLSETEGTRSYPQADIVERRDDLIEGILSDTRRIAAGVALPALGEGAACEYCNARGLCRKDFWELR